MGRVRFDAPALRPPALPTRRPREALGGADAAKGTKGGTTVVEWWWNGGGSNLFWMVRIMVERMVRKMEVIFIPLPIVEMEGGKIEEVIEWKWKFVGEVEIEELESYDVENWQMEIL